MKTMVAMYLLGATVFAVIAAIGGYQAGREAARPPAITYNVDQRGFIEVIVRNDANTANRIYRVWLDRDLWQWNRRVIYNDLSKVPDLIPVWDGAWPTYHVEGVTDEPSPYTPSTTSDNLNLGDSTFRWRRPPDHLRMGGSVLIGAPKIGTLILFADIGGEKMIVYPLLNEIGDRIGYVRSDDLTQNHRLLPNAEIIQPEDFKPWVQR